MHFFLHMDKSNAKLYKKLSVFASSYLVKFEISIYYFAETRVNIVEEKSGLIAGMKQGGRPASQTKNKKDKQVEEEHLIKVSFVKLFIGFTLHVFFCSFHRNM